MLPDRGFDFHLEQVTLARTRLRSTLTNCEYINSAEHERVGTIASTLDDVVARWVRNESAVRGLPHGFIHADLKSDNIGLVEGCDQRLLAYDWEYAGWGPLAVDVGTTLVHRDCASHYVQELQAQWPHVRGTDVEYMGCVGELLRALLAIRWLTDGIPSKPADKVLRGIEAQLTIMRARLEELSW
jgi:thiamine kinase-like enzyme